jgi:cyclophilin family peptidyl-prolyl cis-trans isomerase
MSQKVNAAALLAALCLYSAGAAAQKPAPAPAAPKPAAAPIIVLETSKGTIEIETYPADAPKTVARLTELMKRNFYNGLRFHRVEKRLVQIGDPVTRDMSRQAFWGSGGSGTAIGAAEIAKRRRHGPGTVAMAHAGDPKFADSQFYITKAATPEFDGKYTIFGRVSKGLDVVSKIEKADILKKAYVKP